MSEYFRVLKRIQGEPQAGEAPRRSAAATAKSQPSIVVEPSLPANDSVLARAQKPPAFAALFDNLRATTGGRPLRCLVFAGVSGQTATQATINGLSHHLESRGLEILRAELSEAAGRALIRRRQELSDGHDPLHLDLHAHDWDSDFTNWLHGNMGGPDLALIEGRPLAQSIDAALLARVCDGLVIVAETEVTPRDQLKTAVDRARAAGCRVLGLVMYGTTERMPGWLRRLLGRTSRLWTPSEE